MRRDWLLPQIASVMLSLLAAGAFGEKFRVCIPYLRASTSDVEVLTALAAIDDVNGRQCGLLGGSCPETLQGSDAVTLQAVVVDVASSTIEAAADAANDCMNQGADVVVGPINMPDLATAVFLAGIEGLPTVSHVSNTQLVSSQAGRQRTGSVVYSDASLAAVAASFLMNIGANEVALLHSDNLEGRKYAKATETPDFFPSACSGSWCRATPTPWDSLAAAAVVPILSLPIPVQALLRDQPNLVTHPFALDSLADSRVSATLRTAKKLLVKVLLIYGLEGHAGQVADAAEEAGVDIVDFIVLFGSPSHQAFFRFSAQGVLEASDADLVGVLGMHPQFVDRSADLEERLDAAFEAVSAILPGLSRAHVSNIRPHLMYDAVWSVAVLAAGSTASLLKNESMGQTLSQLGKLPTAFEGITGKVEWDSDGNRDMSGAAVSFVNVVSDRGGVVVQTVASWTPGGGTTLNPNMTITWGDGLQYPRLPGYQTNLGPRWGEWKVMLVGVAIGLSLCLGLAAVVFFRTKYTRLQSFNSPADPSTSLASKFRQDSECSDKTAEDVRVIESPVAKIIDFLKRYDAGGRKKPKAAEARELLQVIENADDLWSPDLQAQLTGNPYDNNVTDYLVHATSVAPPSREPKKGLLRSYSMHSKFDLMQLVDAEHVDREPSFRKLLGVRYTTDVQDPEAHEYAMKVAAETTRPQDTLDQIGTDFTLDFISLGTARHESRVSLCAVVKQCIKSLGISHVLKSKEKLLQLLAFASRVEDGYMDQGYHCKIHAADVTHRLTCVLNHSGIAEGSKRNNSLSCELLAAVVAAVVHDFEHPQVSNGFMVSAEASMAVAFNFQAVAENHSLRASIALMSQTEYNFTSAWDDKYEVHKFKNAMIKNVLATDMSRHFELLAQFKTKVVRGDALNGKECREVWMDWDYNLRSLVLQVAMKVADLGHCTLPIDQHRQWVQRLQDEMFSQGDMERERGMQISPMMDRNHPGVLSPSSQIGFFEVIVIPLMELWVEAFPGCMTLLAQTEENLEYWRNEEEKHNPKPERQSAGRQTDRSSISIIRDMARGATSSFRPGSKRVRKSASFFVNDHVKLGDGHRRSTATLNRVVL